MQSLETLHCGVFISILPGQNAAILADDIFKCISWNGNDRIQIQIPMKLISQGPTDNKPALVQIIAWWRTGVT